MNYGPIHRGSTETRVVVVEREIAHPPEKVWRALTQPHLIEEWLMKNDFEPVVGHRFHLRGDWGGVLDCEVIAIEPNQTLSYTWNHAHDDPAFNLHSVVTFTLTPIGKGTLLRTEPGPEGLARRDAPACAGYHPESRPGDRRSREMAEAVQQHARHTRVGAQRHDLHRREVQGQGEAHLYPGRLAGRGSDG